ncbi:myb-related transcription factor, partner of profilin-like [Pleurodeles waltl]|uniref:myb-related transcription factor, partner of profilin-like n=1 Tax=Pleurodeles waltl TaxID=8319 RepID=UPI0037094803
MEETGSAGRRRKLKFSDKELEVLTEECCLHHSKLFGKAALSAPDTEKKMIWQQIQERINAIGVSHRTLDEIKKRWYDQRSTTKERVAEWLREMRGTGGGPSTVPPPTAMEAMVEQTLEPEAIIGRGEVDTSAPETSKSSLPQSFKHAIIKPLLKKPKLDPSSLENYRPIGLLPILAKILEKHVNHQLTNYLGSHELLHPSQMGFRAQHSTESALLTVTESARQLLDQGGHTAIILLDLSAAFDTVDHYLL